MIIEKQNIKKLPILTVCILTYNREIEVLKSLKLLNCIDYPKEKLEIIVVDNASVDNTSKEIEKNFKNVKLICLEKNKGIAGWNDAFKASKGKYLLVLDDDSAPKSGVTEAIMYLEENKEVDVLACNIEGGAHTLELEDKEEFIGFIGCGVIISKKVFEEVGGFAEWIGVYAHEWEYGLRVIDKGYKIQFFKNCIIEHRASVINRSNERLRKYSTRNEMLIINRYFPRKRFIYLARTYLNNVIQFRTEGLGCIKYATKGMLEYIKARKKVGKSYMKWNTCEIYADKFWTTQPIIYKGNKRK